MLIPDKKKIVVTGGAGFIGSHIVDALIKQGNRVVVIDNLSTGNLKNIEHLLKRKTLEFIQGSITNLSLLQKCFSGVDYVFHQAAVSSVPESIENPSASHEVNVTGTLNVLLAARDNKVHKVVYASSSAVYGDSPTLPKQEDMPPNPQSPYAITKLSAEYYCLNFNKVYGLPTACLRYFNIYGPRQNQNSQYAAVIPKFIQLVSQGKSPVIYGDGEQTRDFTFVRDVVSANLLAAEKGATGVFNIGRGERISLNSLADSIINLCGNNVKAIHETSRNGDIKHSVADISKAKSIGWNPQFNVEQGIKETIRSFIQ